MPQIQGSNPNIGKILLIICQLQSEKEKKICLLHNRCHITEQFVIDPVLKLGISCQADGAEVVEPKNARHLSLTSSLHIPHSLGRAWQRRFFQRRFFNVAFGTVDAAGEIFPTKSLSNSCRNFSFTNATSFSVPLNPNII